MSNLLAQIDCIRVLAQVEHNRHCDEMKVMVKREELLAVALKTIIADYSRGGYGHFQAKLVAQQALEELGLNL